MEAQEIKIGAIVRHRHLMLGTNLTVVKINGNNLIVRYVNQGLFQTQELYLFEVELFVIDKDEYD